MSRSFLAVPRVPATVPGSPNQGDIYFDGTANTAYCYDGTRWQAMQAWATWVFSKSGTIAVVAGTSRMYADVALFIDGARASVNTAPTGATLLVDVNKNGTTIFTTQANRPTIAAGGFTAVSGTPDVQTLAVGDYLTVDVDQVGSTVAGSDLTVNVRVRRT